MLYLQSKTPPNWHRYADDASESEHPELWRYLTSLFVPALGPTGLVVRDLSQYRSNGSIVAGSSAANSIRWSQIGGDSALYWPTIGDYPRVTFAPRVTPVVSATFWIHAFLTNAAAQGLLDCWSGYGFLLNLTTSGLPYFQAIGSTTVTINGDANITAGRWYSLVGRTDNHAMTLWVNGIRQTATDTDTNNAGSVSYQIGRQGSGYTSMKGWVKAAGIWKYALPDSLIQLLAQDPLAPVRIRRRFIGAAVAAGGTPSTIELPVIQVAI